MLAARMALVVLKVDAMFSEASAAPALYSLSSASLQPLLSLSQGSLKALLRLY
jgi:hypothetical protein